MNKKETTLQRVRRLTDEVEASALKLIGYAENYPNQMDSTYWRRKELFVVARRYAVAIDRLNRARS